MSCPAYAQGPSDIPLRGETIGGMWDDVVAENGARPALVARHQGIRWTYAELHGHVERCARALLAAGVTKGDRVGIWSPNNAEWVIVQFATAKIGAVLVNINPSYRSHELEYALRQSGWFPKGATLSHHNILNNGFFIGEILGYTPEDRVCIPVPFYHCFGMVLGNLAVVTHGACIVLPGEGFDAHAVLETVAEERCTSLYGVPTMFIAELADPDFAGFDLTSLRTGIMAGSPCPVEVMKRVQSDLHMGEVTICYGMTETSPVSTQTRRDAPLEKQVSTVGRVHPHVEVKVVDPDTGRTVGRGETGELCTRGYCVMLGYWNDERATREAIDAARWMHTGDLAVMDDEGYVNIVGRIKDMIIRGGENIYPREIEEFLYTHPAIEDVQVIGVPDERYGEAVCAWVVLKEGAELDEDELKEFCRGKIARFKIPHYVRFVDSFPMTVTGKVQKFRMREVEIEERGLAEVTTA